MKLILFSKKFQDRTSEQLIELGMSLGIDGYDLCVRPQHPVNPENVEEELPRVVTALRENGLDVPMVTGHFDLLSPDHPTARPVLSAMKVADVRLLKLGYFKFDPSCDSYLAEVERIRDLFGGWQELAAEYGVKICYHTHSRRCMGLNAAALAHLLADFDPRRLGAYIDTGHLVTEGEEFPTAAGMVRDYLSIVAVKDALLTRVEKNGHGSIERRLTRAGEGMVDWTTVFNVLGDRGFEGPVSIHCEFEVEESRFLEAVKQEVRFFRRFCPGSSEGQRERR